MHGEEWNDGSEGATPRVEGSYDRCASPESFHPLRSSGVHHFTAVPVPLPFPHGRG
nr:hypothetical protein [Paenibacillus polymyxa]